MALGQADQILLSLVLQSPGGGGYRRLWRSLVADRDGLVQIAVGAIPGQLPEAIHYFRRRAVQVVEGFQTAALWAYSSACHIL